MLSSKKLTLFILDELLDLRMLDILKLLLKLYFLLLNKQEKKTKNKTKKSIIK